MNQNVPNSVSTAQKKNLVSTYLKGIDSQINKKGSTNVTSIMASGNVPLGTSSSGGHTKIIGTSRNNALIAPAGTKNKVGATAHIHTALVNLGNSSIGASIDDFQGGVTGLQGSSQILNRTLGGTSASGNRYF
jgi:hypothetical protein